VSFAAITLCVASQLVFIIIIIIICLFIYLFISLSSQSRNFYTPSYVRNGGTLDFGLGGRD
jgi:hypothetical protein